MNPNDPDKLESLIHRTLRSQPDRRAPSSLEARVLGEIHRRAALPWWRKAYAEWPSTVRAGFFAASAVAAAFVFIVLSAVGQSAPFIRVAGQFAGQLDWVAPARQLAGSLAGSFGTVIRAIPPAWLYGTIAAVAALYGTLGAMGAVTYRALASGRRAP
jgi:hypothetical protein